MEELTFAMWKYQMAQFSQSFHILLVAKGYRLLCMVYKKIIALYLPGRAAGYAESLLCQLTPGIWNENYGFFTTRLPKEE